MPSRVQKRSRATTRRTSRSISPSTASATLAAAAAAASSSLMAPPASVQTSKGDPGVENKAQSGPSSDQSETLQTLQAVRSTMDHLRNLISCKMCYRLLYEPYTMACGHTYCYSCLCTWFVNNRSKKTCPDCRADVKHMPAPAYLIREMTQAFTQKAELLPEGETLDEHAQWQKEEAEALQKDKDNTDSQRGGLFRGCFPARSPARIVRPLMDPHDGVERCPTCLWELEDGFCIQCQQNFASPVVDSLDYLGDDMDGVNIETNIRHFTTIDFSNATGGYFASNASNHVSQIEYEMDGERRVFQLPPHRTVAIGTDVPPHILSEPGSLYEDEEDAEFHSAGISYVGGRRVGYGLGELDLEDDDDLDDDDIEHDDDDEDDDLDGSSMDTFIDDDENNAIDNLSSQSADSHSAIEIDDDDDDSDASSVGGIQAPSHSSDDSLAATAPEYHSPSPQQGAQRRRLVTHIVIDSDSEPESASHPDVQVGPSEGDADASTDEDDEPVLPRSRRLR